jgi:type III pantothenate kinase
VSQSDSTPLLAVDVGNNRVKVGAFSGRMGATVPEPEGTWTLLGDAPSLEQVVADCAKSDQQLHWWIGSVNRPTTSRLLDWLGEYRPEDQITLLASGDLPLEVDVPRPDMVGIDRLLAAVAANRIRNADRPAVIVDLGTAVTVDLVSTDGVFQGGAILPGIEMAARALHDYTDLLPRIEMSELSEPPEPLGKATEPAMRSGLYWGAVGAVRELTSQMIADASIEPEFLVTGGAGPMVAKLLSDSAHHVPHLTLAGIALAAKRPPL